MKARVEDGEVIDVCTMAILHRRHSGRAKGNGKTLTVLGVLAPHCTKQWNVDMEEVMTLKAERYGC